MNERETKHVPGATTAPELVRGASHIPGLDTILCGGLFQGGVYLVVGAPGTGKTILGSQLAFNHARTGASAIFLTVLTETHTRLLAHLHSLAFFEPALVGNALNYFSGHSVLAKEGMDGLLALVRRILSDNGATLLVLDGLSTIAFSAPSDLAFHRFLQALQALGELYGCTIMLLSHRNDPAGYSEHAMVDGLIALTNQHAGLRTVRELEVWKFRGSRYLEGRHHFTITEQGITIYPRTEAWLSTATHLRQHPASLLRFGVADLDAMLHGGLPASSTTMLFGAIGSGKTTFGLHFLMEGAQQGEPGLCFGFHESPAQLGAKAQRMGLDIDRMLQQDMIELNWQPPSEQIPDALVQYLLHALERRPVQRLFIDGLNGLLKTLIHRERINDFFAALMNELRARGITTIFSLDTRNVIGPEVIVPPMEISEVVDNIISLRYLEVRSQLHRLISILKVRDGSYDSSVREFTITGQGVRVSESFESAERVLQDVNTTPAPSGTIAGTNQPVSGQGFEQHNG